MSTPSTPPDLRRWLLDEAGVHPRIADKVLSRLEAEEVFDVGDLRRLYRMPNFFDCFTAVTGEKIYVLSSLQEMARNVDTCALAGPGEPVPLRGLEEQIKDLDSVPAGPVRDLLERRRVTDSGSVVAENGHFNAGNKPLMRNGHASMMEFAHWSAA